MAFNLFEGIVGNGQAPNHFWLVLDIPYAKDYGDERDAKNHKILSNLANGQLEGVQGISDSKEILTNWWGMVRNAAIMMDSAKVIDQNDIEQVQYDDPDHLCQNNMSALYRLFSKKTDKWGRDGLMLNIMQYTLGAMKTINSRLAQGLDYYGAARAMCEKWREDPDTVNRASDLAKSMLTTLSTHRDTKFSMDADYQDGDIEKSVMIALQHAGRIYADEKEWIVHGTHFHVPQGSVMLVGVDMEIVAGYDEWKAWSNGPQTDSFQYMNSRYRYENYERLMANIEQNNLRQYYKIKMIDADKFEALRPVLNSRRRARLQK